AKFSAGMPRERTFPRFAAQSFTRWFRRRTRPRDKGRAPVLLWPDTFNDHFHPETLIAAVNVLEAAGYQVTLPPRPLCCGRPLYDYGMLDLAERQLRQILDTLRTQIAEGMLLVGLE